MRRRLLLLLLLVFRPVRLAARPPPPPRRLAVVLVDGAEVRVQARQGRQVRFRLGAGAGDGRLVGPDVVAVQPRGGDGDARVVALEDQAVALQVGGAGQAVAQEARRGGVEAAAYGGEVGEGAGWEGGEDG